MIARKVLSLPEPERQAYRDLLNEIHTHTGVWGRIDPVNLLPHTALGYDWQAYVARVHAAAAAAEANSTGRMVDGTPPLTKELSERLVTLALEGMGR
jgi:hypothetical protein